MDENILEDNLQSDEEFVPLLKQLEDGMDELYLFRDFYFEKNPIEKAKEKNNEIEAKLNELMEKFEEIDENQLPVISRARYLYLKGRTYNVHTKYDTRASQCLSKAVKLNPRLVEAWNELGECYWKNMNIKDAKNSFEGALKNERSKVALRCLSIIIRQEQTNTPSGNKDNVQQSVELAKEAVALDCKDGVSWCVLGNAYMCQYFLVSQDPAVFKACMSAYKQAALDPVARGHPDLYYNRGMALKYDERYEEALQDFQQACNLDPEWPVAKEEMRKLVTYLTKVNDLTRTRGKIKAKKIQQMVESIDPKMLGVYGAPNTFHTFGKRKDVQVTHCPIDSLVDGVNEGKVILGKVVGSIHNEDAVPFAFAVVDAGAGGAACVSVYNWAGGRGALIGDSVALPEPARARHRFRFAGTEFNFVSVRVNNPTMLLVNGKRIGREQFAGTRVTSTYEVVH